MVLDIDDAIEDILDICNELITEDTVTNYVDTLKNEIKNTNEVIKNDISVQAKALNEDMKTSFQNFKAEIIELKRKEEINSLKRKEDIHNF